MNTYKASRKTASCYEKWENMNKKFTEYEALVNIRQIQPNLYYKLNKWKLWDTIFHLFSMAKIQNDNILILEWLYWNRHSYAIDKSKMFQLFWKWYGDISKEPIKKMGHLCTEVFIPTHL